MTCIQNYRAFENQNTPEFAEKSQKQEISQVHSSIRFTIVFSANRCKQKKNFELSKNSQANLKFPWTIGKKISDKLASKDSFLHH